MNRTQNLLAVFVMISLVLVAGCERESEPDGKPRSLADAASQLRSSAMVDTTPRGHVAWNGAAQILTESDCYLRGQEYVLSARGSGVALRLIYRTASPGDTRAVDFSRPLLVELHLDRQGVSGAHFRAESSSTETADIRSDRVLSYGSIALESVNAEAQRAYPEGIRADFEFRCS